MKYLKFSSFIAIMATSALGTLHAAPVNPPVVQSFPDITLGASSVTYDANGVDANTGLLTVTSSSATLQEGAAAGGSSDTQSYLGDIDGIAGGAIDTAKDLTLTFHVRNGLGGFTAGDFVGGSVTIGFGLPFIVPSVVQPQYSWHGTVTDFGFEDTGANAWKYFDAAWTVTSDTYVNMPAGMEQFVNGYLTGGSGGIKINLTSAVTASQFSTDWSRTSGVAVDVFASPVPEVDSVWLLAAGLAVLVPVARRRKTS